ncbi:MAG: glycerophosphodiester phosphodiesterase, partial [Gammaproteobacteria bacterium]|nr:glycerophosphodiester phosphodiesterase [Gammaproteobacteria bacterium]
LSGDPDCVYVQCFDDAELRRLKHELKFPWRLVQLLGENSWNEASTNYDELRTLDGLEKVAGWADAIGPWLPQCYEIGNDAEVLPSGLAQAAHDEGLAIHPYTFRVDELPPGFTDFDELLRFFIEDLEVDGLFTDFSDRVRKWLSARQ